MSGSMHVVAQAALLEAGRPDLAEKIEEHDTDPETDLLVCGVWSLPEAEALLVHRAVRVAQLAAGVPVSVCAACWVAGRVWRADGTGTCRGVRVELGWTDCAYDESEGEGRRVICGEA